MGVNTSDALAALQQLEQEQGDINAQLAIIRISEPISDVGDFSASPVKRSSDVSIAALNDPTPASLEADLTHYKVSDTPASQWNICAANADSISPSDCGGTPLVVGHNENVELETQLAEVKAELKSRKEEARLMVEEMGKLSRELADRYKSVEVQLTQLSTLPESIENLESTIAGLRAKQVATIDSSDPRSSHNLPLPATLSLLSEREAELAVLNRQIAAVQNALPRKTREAEAIERECSVLERRKAEAITQAREAQRKKQQGESDGLEEMGRWYRGAEDTLKEVLGVEG
ncbi:hypothetical protein N7462_001766 [Penicillium macrosclerotiorum]|uniref:uncharacterized protein n=1 Tax=Penicillium macrosclerotiorum TaxID=303699 RepID=UPI0025482E48|nr:uncharacterized protein N7462_001766 [Penicillium macrosclerotiorum]KAJ5692343.1 hypothetical protein N7462_001766 [Penicillium macrosclerotiorum]